MGITLRIGQYGRLKASKREFVITKTSTSTTSIRFRFEKIEHEYADNDLRNAADDCEGSWNSATLAGTDAEKKTEATAAADFNPLYGIGYVV